jgi:hypothetical protein
LRSNVPRAMDSRANHSCASCCCSKPSRTSLDCGSAGWGGGRMCRQEGGGGRADNSSSSLSRVLCITMVRSCGAGENPTTHAAAQSPAAPAWTVGGQGGGRRPQLLPQLLQHVCCSSHSALHTDAFSRCLAALHKGISCCLTTPHPPAPPPACEQSNLYFFPRLRLRLQ